MIKTFWTLFRGATYAAEQEVMDRSALLILDQHIRDAAELQRDRAGVDEVQIGVAVVVQVPGGLDQADQGLAGAGGHLAADRVGDPDVSQGQGRFRPPGGAC